jgi:hypothetical protein
MYNQFPLPSLEEIEQMERRRDQALKKVEIYNDGQYVKCQKCHNTVPIVG